MKKFTCVLSALLALAVVLSACGAGEAEVSVNADGYVVVAPAVKHAL